MKIGAIVQARMSSARCPGKVLQRVAGKPVLQYVLERLRRCTLLDGIVVATSTEDSDAAVEGFCKDSGVACVRGSLLNVASRLRDVVDLHGFEAFVRVGGDSPLLDQKIVDRGVKIFLDGDFDLVTNVFPRSYPRGQSVEVMRAETLRRGLALMGSDDEREHVTLFFYRNRERFRIFNFSAEQDHSGLHLAVDDPDDMMKLVAILAAIKKPHWEYGLQDLLEICRNGSGK